MKNDTKIKLNGIDHFALNVRNLYKSTEFYRDILGFDVVKTSSIQSKMRYVVLDAGNVFIDLFEMPDLDFGLAQKTMTDDGYLHFAFGISKENFEEAVRFLKEKNVRLDGEPRDHGDGESVYFYDPDGHIIEIHVQDE